MINTLVREVRTGLEVSGLVLIVPEPSSWGDWLEFIRFGHVTIPTRSLIGCWLSPSPPSDLIHLNPWPSPVILFQCSKHIGFCQNLFQTSWFLSKLFTASDCQEDAPPTPAAPAAPDSPDPLTLFSEDETCLSDGNWFMDYWDSYGLDTGRRDRMKPAMGLAGYVQATPL
uniref:Uncharacterized protein n=1 Tax=Timema bartmani TaxID=61472 RepID=A0A7R9EZ24_9NEOP|nr:unnamed protein product [Timema bartmani]